MKVSVLIPTYNRAHFLYDAILSIKAQTYLDIQIIVYDDGSTDNTQQVIQLHHCGWLTYHRSSTNHGVSYARNALLDLCETEVAAWMDSDDLSNLHRIEGQVGFLGSFDMVYGSFEWFKTTKYPTFWERPRLLEKEDVCNASGLFRVDKSIRFDESLLVGEDNDWRLRMKETYSQIVLPHVWYYIRRHNDRLGVTKGRK